MPSGGLPRRLPPYDRNFIQEVTTENDTIQIVTHIGAEQD